MEGGAGDSVSSGRFDEDLRGSSKFKAQNFETDRTLCANTGEQTVLELADGLSVCAITEIAISRIVDVLTHKVHR